MTHQRTPRLKSLMSPDGSSALLHRETQFRPGQNVGAELSSTATVEYS